MCGPRVYKPLWMCPPPPPPLGSLGGMGKHWWGNQDSLSPRPAGTDRHTTTWRVTGEDRLLDVHFIFILLLLLILLFLNIVNIVIITSSSNNMIVICPVGVINVTGIIIVTIVIVIRTIRLYCDPSVGTASE